MEEKYKRYIINVEKTNAKIIEFMKNRYLTKKDLITIFGVGSYQAVDQRLNGKGLPTIQQFVALSKLFEKSIEEMLVLDEVEITNEEYQNIMLRTKFENEIINYMPEDEPYAKELYEDGETRRFYERIYNEIYGIPREDN